MSRLKRVFVGSLATETNTFSPLRTDLRDFKDSFYAEPGTHPETPTLCSAVFPVARARRAEHGWDLIEGTATWAEPGGVINQRTWELLRDQMLAEIRAAMPLDAVVLGLHGAMVAQDCLDCEGELLAAIRAITGPETIVGATLDPHSHLSALRVENADLLVAFKEFPHTDFVIVAEDLIRLVARALNGEIRPVLSVFDCRMIDVLPTSREPMRGFVDRMRALENPWGNAGENPVANPGGKPGEKPVGKTPTGGEENRQNKRRENPVENLWPKSRATGAETRGEVLEKIGKNSGSPALSISAIHGFMAGDVPDLGAKIIIVTDDQPEAGAALARRLGLELFALRGTTRPEFLTAEEALEQAYSRARGTESGPVVIADVWDNPGGGVAGDSTFILRQLMDRGARNTALASIWDPIAVRTCFSAGEGARLRLRFGGKMSDSAGEPVDADVVVHRTVAGAVQSFGASVVPLGDSVWIEIDGLHVILNTVRSQVFNPDIFSNLGLDPLAMDVLVVKSTNHFQDAFSRIAGKILYAAVDGPYPNDPGTNDYRHLTRRIWPRCADPHS